MSSALYYAESTKTENRYGLTSLNGLYDCVENCVYNFLFYACLSSEFSLVHTVKIIKLNVKIIYKITV